MSYSGALSGDMSWMNAVGGGSPAVPRAPVPAPTPVMPPSSWDILDPALAREAVLKALGDRSAFAPNENDRRMALAKMGIALMQPRQPGQSWAGVVGNAAGGAIDALQASKAAERQAAREKASLALNAATTQSQLKTGEMQQQRMAVLTPLEVEQAKKVLTKLDEEIKNAPSERAAKIATVKKAQLELALMQKYGEDEYKAKLATERSKSAAYSAEAEKSRAEADLVRSGGGAKPMTAEQIHKLKVTVATAPGVLRDFQAGADMMGVPVEVYVADKGPEAISKFETAKLYAKTGGTETPRAAEKPASSAAPAPAGKSFTLESAKAELEKRASATPKAPIVKENTTRANDWDKVKAEADELDNAIADATTRFNSVVGQMPAVRAQTQAELIELAQRRNMVQQQLDAFAASRGNVR